MYANMDDVITILYSAVSRILKTRNLLQILTKSSRLLWPPTSSQRQLGGQLFSSYVVMTMIIFCTCRYNCSQCTNHGCKLLRTTFQMCLIHWTHRHSITVVVFDSNDLSWLSLEVPLWFIGRVTYYYYYNAFLWGLSSFLGSEWTWARKSNLNLLRNGHLAILN